MKLHEAFHNLSMTEDLKKEFENTEVKKVVISKNTKEIVVIVEDDRLINRTSLISMENILMEQIFTGNNQKIRIEERSNLSEYSAEYLFELAKDSLFDEISEKGKGYYSILLNSEIEFIDDVLHITADDNFLIKARIDEISKWLRYVFFNRYNKELDINCNFIRKELEKKEDIYKISEILKNTPSTPIKKMENSDSKSVVRRKLTNSADLIYGKNFDGTHINISEVDENMSSVILRGKILKIEDRETKTGKFIVLFDFTDFTDSISCKIWVDSENIREIRKKLRIGSTIKVFGKIQADPYQGENILGQVVGIKEIDDFSDKRSDKSGEKRVELHLHTIMSEMDAVVNVEKLFKTLSEWGHKAVAITDHGVVQSFTEAYHVKKNLKLSDFKIIYGVEGYLVDDIPKIVKNPKGQKLTDSAVIFDIETTGFGPKSCKIIEIGAVKVRNGKIVDTFSSFVNPEIYIPKEIVELTGITQEMVVNEPEISMVLPQFLDFCKDSYLVAHNADFDTSFIFENMRKLGIEPDFTVIDTVKLSRLLLENLKNYKLDTVALALSVQLLNHHRAVDDANCTAEIYMKLIEKFISKYGSCQVEDINKNSILSKSSTHKLRSSHIIILAKNDIGRINLYKLISMSHLEYFNRKPRIPRSLLIENREGLIIGSACADGELYQSILKNMEEKDIEEVASFYDYLEIQPIANNSFLIESNRTPDVMSETDLREINKRIVSIGEKLKKPVVATCDVHFLNPTDEVFRRLILNSKGMKDTKTPLYLRTTDEMLEEFSYLGIDKAREVVIKNTNLIADMVEHIKPVRPDRCPPIIKNSDEELREICYKRAREIYGKNLPTQVVKRLEHELNSIIHNGFAVMYIIAQKLVWKSNEDGYLVGSRGSVGSSFVAFLSGITEVNSLSAHYYCKYCDFVDFDSEIVKKFTGMSGCDLPDRKCPICGNPLEKDGHDIPFETFLGFNGDKEPDIDLNFSGEYQGKAHAYTEVIFGQGQTYRAGTIGGVAEKTAYGYVLKYNEEHGILMRKAEIERLSKGCIGVRRTTGQHPGGIVVLPIGEDIYSFTPIQHPANDTNTQIITTHFDYHSIDHNLLKLDILGHDDPTMIRMLEDLTGVDARSIRLDDERVLSLFTNLNALSIEASELDGYDLGSLGIPEFGTDFVMQMLRETKPKNFSDLVRISGLSHGTDVWTGNAQSLINEGRCELSTAICTRDDIMIYLIDKGLEPGLAFKIMESVRKGKGLTEEWEEKMKEVCIPDWYIWSCKKIAYMFPKAHAVAYVMMGFRIAYFKVYHPLAYYTAFFSIRASAFDYGKFCFGKGKLLDIIKNIKSIEKKDRKKKDEDVLGDAYIVLEMYARGFEFMPIDIYKAKPKQFQIIDGKIMPSLITIDGLGDKAAYILYESAKNGKFLSKDDLRKRAKGLTQTAIDKMTELGILNELPNSSQISMFDFI